MTGSKRQRSGGSKLPSFVKKKSNTDSFSLSLSEFTEQSHAASLASSSTYHDELSLSSDLRRVKRLRLAAPPARLPEPPPLPSSSDFNFTTFEEENPDWQDNAPVEDEDGEEDEDELEDGAQKASRYASSDEPMRQWLPFRSQFLAELMRTAGRGGTDTVTCFVCHGSLPSFRCKDCFGVNMVCSTCMVTAHQANPLHIIERWTGKFFRNTSLKALGLRVQLGHHHGEQCNGSRPAHKDFIVFHTNGIHDVSLDYCLCQSSEVIGHYWQQLMRRKWYPGSVTEPRTACTFEVLKLFHCLTLQGKMSLYDFYAGLEKRTDNTGTVKLKFRYPTVSRIMRQYRYLIMLLRGGVGNTPDRDLDDLKPGELAVLCPVCPRPGINLPDEWESAPPEMKFLYFLFLSVDACFRLKRRLVSNEERDPGLATGATYFVPDGPFREFLTQVTDQLDMSTCSGLAALDQANTKFSRGYACTGAGVCVCGRHELVQPEGAVDLQKGERYANMDYLFASVQKHHDPRLKKVFSYDINCQYHKNLPARLLTLPPRIRLQIVMRLFAFVIPKLHIKGHARACQALFSLSLLFGAGMTDAEGIERQWASLGPIATSTREMGPGYRHDTIDDHFANWNWQKIVRLGIFLRRRLRDAIEQHRKQAEVFSAFCEQQVENAEIWKQEALDWEAGKTTKNPFDSPSFGLSEHDVRQKLTQDEAMEEQAGAIPMHEVSPSAFISTFLELEEQRRQITLAASVVSKSPSPQARTALIERRTRLQRGIASLRSLQATYTPAALQELRKTAPNAPLDTNQAVVELIPLLPPTELVSLGYTPAPNLLQIEIEFREAQLRTSLHDLRNHLFVKSRLLTQKNLHARHQGATTRARALLERNDRKIAQYAAKYRAGWFALKQGYNNQESLVLHRKLVETDIRCLDDDQSTAGARIPSLLGHAHTIPTPMTTGSRATVSWIWLGIDTTDTETLGTAIAEAVRVEFCKSWARERRWREEKQLLLEEMRRTLVTFRWQAARWKDSVVAGSSSVDADAEARNAYSYRQAHIRHSMAKAFETLWSTPLPPYKPRVRRAEEPTEGEYGDAPLNYDEEGDTQEGIVDPHM